MESDFIILNYNDGRSKIVHDVSNVFLTGNYFVITTKKIKENIDSNQNPIILVCNEIIPLSELKNYTASLETIRF